MSGEQVTKKLEVLGISKTKMAEMLGYSVQRLQNALASENIKTGLLENIASCVGKPIGWFYDEDAKRSLEFIEEVEKLHRQSYFDILKGLQELREKALKG